MLVQLHHHCTLKKRNNNIIYRLPPLPPTPPKLSSVNFAEYVVIAVRFGSFSDFTNRQMPWVRMSRDWCAGRPSLCVSELEIQYLLFSFGSERHVGTYVWCEMHKSTI